MTNPQSLAQSIASLYPEIANHGIKIAVGEDQATGDWLVTIHRSEHSLSTHLTKKEADDCLAGIQCVSLAVQIGRFVENYCLGLGGCPAQ